MLLPAGLRLIGAYAAASEESPAKLAATVRQFGELLPPHMVRWRGLCWKPLCSGWLAAPPLR
jgi:hypothetical protein